MQSNVLPGSHRRQSARDQEDEVVEDLEKVTHASVPAGKAYPLDQGAQKYSHARQRKAMSSPRASTELMQVLPGHPPGRYPDNYQTLASNEHGYGQGKLA